MYFLFLFLLFIYVSLGISPFYYLLTSTFKKNCFFAQNIYTVNAVYI